MPTKESNMTSIKDISKKRLVDIFEHSGKEAGLWKLSELTDQTIQDIWRYLKENIPDVYEEYLRPGSASIVSRSLATHKRKKYYDKILEAYDALENKCSSKTERAQRVADKLKVGLATVYRGLRYRKIKEQPPI